MKDAIIFMRRWLLFLFFFGLWDAALSQNLESSNLPIVVIDTEGVEIQNEPKISATMGIINNETGIRNDIEEAVELARAILIIADSQEPDE